MGEVIRETSEANFLLKYNVKLQLNIYRKALTQRYMNLYYI